MSSSEFNQWKSEAGIDLIDIYFHCIHQKPLRPEAEPEEEPPEMAPDGGQQRLVTDGGSSMPKFSLEHLKELREMDGKIGEWLSEKVGEDIGGMTDLYESEHSIVEAMNDIELGEGFSLKEPEYIELLTLLDSGRQAAGDDPPTLGVRNRLLMNVILANPEAYARIRKEMTERAKEAQEEMERLRNQQRERQRMTDRHQSMDGATQIDIDGDEEEKDV